MLVTGHYLLWRIGVVHGDISIGNLMYDAITGKAILNDYDLLNPGDAPSQKKGWERTGTKPFLALKFLKKTDGSAKRMYRHDLESFAWCLWCGMNESFPDKAIYGSTIDAYDSKAGLALHVLERTSAKSGFESIWKCVADWVYASVWLSFPSGLEVGEDEDGRQFVKVFLALADKNKLQIPLDGPQLNWVDFQVSQRASSSSTHADMEM